jgi:hypothetical protein
MYELAEYRGRRGVATPSFVPVHGRLILGNELIARVDRGYLTDVRFRNVEHTIHRVLAVVDNNDVRMPLLASDVRDARIERGVDVFVGYLLLDAWIANQDRHHENWGFVVTADQVIHLAPTFDHASSLGRNERDPERERRLRTRDRGQSMEAYVARARSALYGSPGDSRPLTTIAAFERAARRHPAAAAAWMDRLAAISDGQIAAVFRRIPEELCSELAREFAIRMLELNRARLIAGMQGELP